MMETTTTNCQICNDRGVIHTDVGFGFVFSKCDCRPAEHWAEKSRQRAEYLKQMIVDLDQKLG